MWEIPFFKRSKWTEYQRSLEKSVPPGLVNFLYTQPFRSNLSILSLPTKKPFSGSFMASWEMITLASAFYSIPRNEWSGRITFSKVTINYVRGNKRRTTRLIKLLAVLLVNGLFRPENNYTHPQPFKSLLGQSGPSFRWDYTGPNCFQARGHTQYTATVGSFSRLCEIEHRDNKLISRLYLQNHPIIHTFYYCLDSPSEKKLDLSDAQNNCRYKRVQKFFPPIIEAEILCQRRNISPTK